MNDDAPSWVTLSEPWQAVLALAWESLAAGSIPIGAVLVSESDEIVGRGRNRIYDRSDPPRLHHAYDPLAHAELNALAGLDPERHYQRHVLYTALEPCILCVGAAIMTTVGTIRYAGSDPYGGADGGLVGVNPHLRRAPVVLDGPRPDVVGLYCSALVVAYYLIRKPRGRVVLAFSESQPTLVQAAHVLLRGGVIEEATSGVPLASVFDRLCATLVDAPRS